MTFLLYVFPLFKEIETPDSDDSPEIKLSMAKQLENLTKSFS